MTHLDLLVGYIVRATTTACPLFSLHAQRDPELPFPHLVRGNSPQWAVQLPLQQLRGVLPGQWGSARSRIAFSALGSQVFARIGCAVAFIATAWRFARPVGGQRDPELPFPHLDCGDSSQWAVQLPLQQLHTFSLAGTIIKRGPRRAIVRYRTEDTRRPRFRTLPGRRSEPDGMDGINGGPPSAVASRSARAAPSVRFTFWIASNTREKTRFPGQFRRNGHLGTTSCSRRPA